MQSRCNINFPDSNKEINITSIEENAYQRYNEYDCVTDD